MFIYFKDQLIFSALGILVFGILFVRGVFILPYVLLVIVFYTVFAIYIKKS